MGASVDNWQGPGSGGPTVAPDTFWWHADAAGQTVSTKCQFFTAGGVLTTVNATLDVWDVTSGAALFSQSGTGVNTLTTAGISMTSGHTVTHRITYNGGTSCDHCICSVTSITASTSNHPIYSIRRSAAWSGVGGNLLRLRRNGAWVIINGGIFLRRSGAWVTI